MKHFLLILIFLMLAPNAFAAKVQEIKTPTGFTVWLVEEHSLPLVTVNIGFTGSGTAYDPADREGRTNMVAALLMEGAGERDAKAFNAALEERAIRMNIGADDDAVYATFSTLAENKNDAFAMLADALVRPRFDVDAVSRARSKMQVLLVEQSAAPGYKLSRAFQESAYGKHPYAQMGIGTKETLDALSADDLQEYAKRYLTRENIIISVVGDITPADISALVDKHLAALPERYAPDSTVGDVAMPPQPDTTVIKHDMPQTMVAFGLNGLKRADPDYIPAYVMNHMLGSGGLGSRLAREIRIKRGLAYSVTTQLSPKNHAGLWRGMFATRNAQAKNALAALTEVLAETAKNGVTEGELADAKAYLTGSFMLDLSSNQEVASFLTMMQIHKLGSDYMEKRNGLIEQVSLADIRRVTQRLIDPSRPRVVMVGSPEL